MSSPVLAEELKKQVSALPDNPGVYMFFNDRGDIIYIGKAVSLKSRVRSYWNSASWRERPKLAVMMPKVVRLETVLTNSEKEALLLEATLIRKHLPRYNVALKDDRRYPWLAITYDVAYPRLIMVRDPGRFRKGNSKAKIFGPYVEAGAMWQTVKVLRKVFPMRQRKSPLFKDRPCMNYHIGLCLGPCQKLVSEEDYDRMVKQVELFLAGRQMEVVSQMRRDMQAASDEMEFEKAAKLRDRLRALETVIERQQVFFQNSRVSQDIFAEVHTDKLLILCLMRVREGKLISSDAVTIHLTDRTTWDEAYQSFINQYYADCEDVNTPSDVILQHEVDDRELLSQLLSSKAGKVVKLLVPQKGEKLRLIEMARKNAEQTLEHEMVMGTEDRDAKAERILAMLKEELGIKQLPRRIECFDISNIQGTDNVASMVVFEYGVPKKSDYRTFKIKSVEGTPNDFASMNEVVTRRYSKLLKEEKPFPELIVIDGGKGQLGAAMEALHSLEPDGLSFENFDIMGLAKRQEEIYLPGRSNPILLSRRSEALHLLQHIRNEAHRFAITYHRKLRAKRSHSSKFDSLPGVGASRRKLLIEQFGTFNKLKEATLEEIEAIKGISAKLAQSIYDFVHEGEKPQDDQS